MKKKLNKLLMIIFICILPVIFAACGGGSEQSTVNLYFNTGITGSKIPTMAVKPSQSIYESDLEVPTDDGYAFDGWYNESSYTTEVEFPLQLTQGKTIYAKWTKLFTITFRQNNGSEILAEHKIKKGEGLSLIDAPEVIGYNFIGCYYNNERVDEYTDVTSDLTLTAGYAIKISKVNFVYDSGKTQQTESVNYGQTINAPSAEIREGYNFVGWFSSEGEEFSKDAKIYTDLTFTARYEIVTCLVRFTDIYGSVYSQTTVKYGESVELPSPPIEIGYIFTGWYIGNEEYTNEPITGNTQIDAKFVVNLVKDIVITGDYRTEYLALQTFDTTGLELVITYQDNTSHTIIEGFAVTYMSGDCLSASDTHITLTIGSISKEIAVAVDKLAYDMSAITFTDLDVTYDGSAHAIITNGVLPQGVTVEYENNIQTNAGVYGAIAIFTGDTINYHAIPNMTATLEIVKADIPNITFEDKTVDYDGNHHSIMIIGTLPSVIDVVYTGNDNKNAGVYTVIATLEGDFSNYNQPQPITAILTINKLSYDMSGITFKSKSVTYNATIHSIYILGVLPEGVTVDYENNSKVHAGEYTALANFSGDTINYNDILPMSATLTIAKANYDMSKVSFEDSAFVYSGNEYSIYISGNLPIGVTVEYTNNQNIDVGVYIVIASFLGNGNNYHPIPNMQAELEIVRADITEVRFLNGTAIYNGNPHSLAIRGELPSGIEVRYENNEGNINVGEYMVTAYFFGDFGNHKELEPMTATLTIRKATYNVSQVNFEDKTVTYNGAPQNIGITGNLPSGVDVEYHNNNNINAGVYTVEASFSGDYDNYHYIEPITAILTIVKATYDMSSVIFIGKTVIYDGNSYSIAVTDNLPSGVSVEYQNNDKTNVGIYTVVANFSGDYDNYNDIEPMTADINIEKATYDMSSVIFIGKTVIYDGNSYSIAVTDNLPSGVSVEYQNNDKTNAGIYTVVANFSGDYDNYNNIEPITAIITIEKATYVISSDVKFEDVAIIYNGTPRSIFVTGTLPDGVTVEYHNNARADIGTYTITAYFIGDFSNYHTIADMTATLTIFEYGEYTDESGIEWTYTMNNNHITLADCQPSEQTTSVTLPSQINSYSVVDVAPETFNNYTALTEILVENNNPYFESDNHGVLYTKNKTELIRVPVGWTNNNGTPVFAININVVTVRDYAFYKNSYIRYILIGASMKNITGKSFIGARNVIRFNGSNNYFSTVDDVLLGNAGKTLVKYPEAKTATSYSIPSSVEVIDSYAFYQTRNTNITTGSQSQLKEIKSYAFYKCENLTRITVGSNTLETLHSNAISICEKLTGVQLVSLLTDIQESAITQCHNLQYVSITDTQVPVSLSKAYDVNYNVEWYRFNNMQIGEIIDYDVGERVYDLNQGGYYYLKILPVEEEGWEYYVFDGKVEVAGYIGIESDATIPSILGGYEVTAIRTRAFEYNSLLTSIIIPNTINYIGKNAFAYSNLRSIEIPSSIITIGTSAFDNCNSLTGVYITDITAWVNIFFADSYANPLSHAHNLYLNGELVTELIIPEGVISITSSAFYNCSSLTQITIPDSVTSIGYFAFSGCSSLTNIALPNSVTSIDASAFIDCSSLTLIKVSESNGYYQSIEGILFNKSGTTLIAYPANKQETSYTIPNDVTSIGSYAFSGCSAAIIWGDDPTIATIGNSAFRDYQGDSITIPNSISSIGSYAFEGCVGLTQIAIPNSVTSIGSYAFSGCRAVIIWGDNPTITTVGTSAFRDYQGDSIAIPNSVTSIGYFAFSGCSSLTNIALPNSVTSIFSDAFNGCTAAIIWGDNPTITTIGNFAFRDYQGDSIAIPDSVTSIFSDAFNGCTAAIIWGDNPAITTIGTSAFRDYQGDSIAIPNSVTSIGSSAFEGCVGLTQIAIPNSVTSIGSSAFVGCSSLTSITLPFIGNTLDGTSYTHFGYIFGAYSYSNNSSYVPPSLKTVIITKAASIGTYAFYGCSSLTSIAISDSVTSIGSDAFNNCSSLTSITIPDSVTSIGFSAFAGCSSLTSVYTADIAAWANISFANSYANPLYYAKNLYLNSELVTELIVPEYTTNIRSYAFYNCSSLTSITLPDSLTSIGSYAFEGCSSLTSITIPDSVTSIGSSAFGGCRSLTSITLPFVGNSFAGTSNTHFGYIFGANTYYSNSSYVPPSLKTVIITKATSIGFGAFYDCSRLTYMILPFVITPFGYIFGSSNSSIPSSLKTVIITKATSIGSDAFRGCSSLTSITIPDSVTSIGSYAFEGCRAAIIWGDNPTITTIGNSAFWDYQGNSLTIPDSVTSIGSDAFERCSNLTSIVIGSSVETIGDSAFRYCSSLTSITIPDSVTSIGSSAFEGCRAAIIWGDNPTITTIGNSAFRGYQGDSITIPDSVTSIDTSAFYGCSRLTSITIPDSVTSIGSYAFMYCSSLISIVIGSSVETIGFSAFAGCSSLTSITLPFIGNTLNGTSNTHFGYIFGANSYSNNSSYIPSSLKTVIITKATSIGFSAFRYCDSLTSITIPDSVTTIGSYAFIDCSSLTSINVPVSNGYYKSIEGILFNKSGTTLIAYPANKQETSYTIPNNVTSIGSDAFSGCSVAIIWGDNPTITTIGHSAFKGYQGNSLTIPDSVTSIDTSAFYGCSRLTSITIPDSVTSIDTSAFYGCSRLTSITIPDSVTSIGSYAFKGCSSLISIVIGSSVETIGASAFIDCSSLMSINVSVSNGYYKSIEGILFNKSGTTLIAYPAYKLGTSYTIPNSVTSIGSSAFYGCRRLTSIVIGSSVETIGDSAFEGCSGLTQIIIPNRVTSIGYYAFYGCSSLTIYARPTSKPSGWHSSWNSQNRPVIWGYKGN